MPDHLRSFTAIMPRAGKAHRGAKSRLLSLLLVVALGWLGAWGSISGVWGRDDGPTGTESERAFFREKMLPLLKQHCFRCHGGESKVQGGLVLTRRQGILDGGDSGEAVDLVDAPESLLIKAIEYEGLEMPPDRRLSDEEVQAFSKWIELGLPFEGDHSYQPQ